MANMQNKVEKEKLWA